MSGIAAVMDRIQTIEAAIGQLATPAGQGLTSATSATTATQATTATSGSDFAQLLSQATGSTAAGQVSPTAPTAATAAAGAAPGEPTGADLVSEARKYLGVPYVWGGRSPSGLDCSGLVSLSLENLGVSIKRTARQQMTEGQPVASLDEAMPGDLLIFNNGTHVAIYLGDGQMIDAPKPGGHVNERAVYEKPTAIRRVLPAVSAPAPAPALLAEQASALSAMSLGTTASLAGTSAASAALDSERLALTLFSGGAA